MTGDLVSKADFRGAARRRRAAMADRDRASRQILDRVVDSPRYQNAQRILFYVSTGSEVTTQAHLRQALLAAKTVFVPICLDNHLRLFRLESLDELASRTRGIMEPREALWDLSERFAPADSIDLAIIPGVAFGRDGTRIGQGRGYYDRLLAETTTHPYRLALAFECQMFDHVPSSAADAAMDQIVTESAEYHGARCPG